MVISINLTLYSLFGVSITFIVYILIVYPYLLRWLAFLFGSKHETVGFLDFPSVTIVVPCFNEEVNVSNKLEDIFKTRYPKDKMEVLFVDNGSTDKTVVFLENLLGSYSFRLITSPPGKTQAINKALAVSSAEIIVSTDCDTSWSKDALEKLIQPLACKNIGAVCATPRIRKSIFNSKLNYHIGEWIIRSLESELDTCSSLDGRLMAFKKSALGTIREDASTDDLEITLALRKKGFRSLALRDVMIEEDCLQTLADELKQIRRRVYQSLFSIAHYRTMLLNPRYGFFGVFILPSRRLFPIFLPFSLILSLGSALFLWPIPSIIFICMTLFICFFTGNSYKLVQVYGISLGWIDTVLLKTKGDIWTRKPL